jgi:Cu/Ag efflux protein CusF
MLRRAMILVSLLGAVLLVSAPLSAQMQSPPGQPPAARPPIPSEVEGTVKKVDVASGTVQLSTGLWGLFGRTLAVTGDTQIQLEGRQASLADLREGARVKASYETAEGKSVAKRIEVMAPPAQSAPPQQRPLQEGPKTQ